MLVYEKNNHVYGTLGNVPADADVQLTYKDEAGAAITVPPLAKTDDLRDYKKGFIFDNTLEKELNVFIGDKCIIGEDVQPVVKAAAAKKAVKVVEEVEEEKPELE